LIDELTNHWDEYGLTKDDVHLDYQHKQVGEFKLTDSTLEGYQAWSNSQAFFAPK